MTIVACACPGVTLNSFNVATAEFKFVGRAGVPETMKYHFGEIIFRDEFVKGPVDVICFGRGPLGTGEYKVIISIFIPQQFFQFFNRFLRSTSISATALGEIPSAHLSWFSGSFRASTVELHPRIVGNLNMIPFSPICASDSLEIR